MRFFFGRRSPGKKNSVHSILLALKAWELLPENSHGLYTATIVKNVRKCIVSFHTSLFMHRNSRDIFSLKYS
jgi:hypothetical protein